MNTVNYALPYLNLDLSAISKSKSTALSMNSSQTKSLDLMSAGNKAHPLSYMLRFGRIAHPDRIYVSPEHPEKAAGTSGFRPGDSVKTLQERMDYINQVIPGIGEGAWVKHLEPGYYTAAKIFNPNMEDPKGTWPRILIGADRRDSTQEVLDEAAKMLSQYNIEVIQIPKNIPLSTPVGSFIARHYLMEHNKPITFVVNLSASHNKTPEFGIKVNDTYGIASGKETINKYLAAFQHEIPVFDVPEAEMEAAEQTDVSLYPENPNDQYLAALEEAWAGVIDPEGWKDIDVIFNPQHGTGSFVGDHLDRLVPGSVTLMNMDAPPADPRDPFHENTTEPVTKNLADMLDKLGKAQNHYTVALAVDGDADRFGVAAFDENNEPKLLSINDSSAIALDLLHEKDRTGSLALSQATSHYLPALYQHFYGKQHPVISTAVGWQNLGPRVIEGAEPGNTDVLIALEGSGGLSCSRNPAGEKDGTAASFLLGEAAQMAAGSGKTLVQKAAELRSQLPTKFSFNETAMRLATGKKQKELDEGAARQQDIDFALTQLFNEPTDDKRPADAQRANRIKGVMQEVLDDFGFDMDESRRYRNAVIESSGTPDGFKFIMNDGSWVLFRPSGTEPLFRVLAEGVAEHAQVAAETRVTDLLRAIYSKLLPELFPQLESKKREDQFVPKVLEVRDIQQRIFAN